MNNLEMIKAFAGLEGIKTSINHRTRKLEYMHSHIFACFKEYNPITDLALNCMARDKYNVEVDYNDMSVFIYGDFICSAYFSEKNKLPRAVIECILKSKGLYK